MSKRLNSLSLITCALALLWQQPAPAQFAPTGTHYAGRESDTGFGSGPNDRGGGYAASIPLNVPPSHGGLPIPLQIVSGGREFGAAGLGWEVPLSFVMVDRSYVHRRPAMVPGAPISPRERISVVLPGRSAEMLPQQASGGLRWIGRNAPDLTMQNTGGRWIVYDGNGFTYTFTQDVALFGTGGPGTGGLWLLESIKGPGGAKVLMAYDIKSVAIPDSPQPAISIDVARISYNPHPTTADCFKHEISLAYAIPVNPTPQAYMVLGDRVLMRDHRLAAVDVNSRPGCDAQPERLRRYDFSYQVDPDTRQERLASVKMLGRQGTPEANVSLPVADYSYGSATTSDSTGAILRYNMAGRVDLPTGARRIARSEQVSSPDFMPPYSLSSSKSSATTQNLIDVTGDGRPDLVYKQNDQLAVARNLPGSSGSTVFGANVAFNDNTFTRPVMDARTSAFDRFNTPVHTVNGDDVWTQTIDVNGDGRLDMIDASAKPYHWIVYLNTPDPSPSGIKWVRRAYNVTNLYNEFTSRGLVGNGQGWLPLSRRITGVDYGKWTCWKWNSTLGKYIISPNPITYTDQTAACWVSIDRKLPEFAERTWIEWEIKDLNGDGYPDVVYNSSPIRHVSAGPPSSFSGFEVPAVELFNIRPTVLPNPVRAVFNVRGTFISSTTATDPFSSPTVVLQNSYCGVGRWQTGYDLTGVVEAKNRSSLQCGLADVNGDGLIDRIEAIDETPLSYHTALLGTGSGFGTVRMRLPAQLAQQDNTYDQKCNIEGKDFYVSSETVGLRDLTGDGIPDFIDHLNSGGYRVHIGTGAGFAPPIAVQGGFEISRVDDRCNGFGSDTNGGLYDVDGDGIPERINLIPLPNSAWALEVWKLAGSTPGVPEAGRLVRIDNGYGAQVNITYRSAKEDPLTKHQVASPEIVVSSISTTGTKGFGGTLATTQYAYGNIDRIYDSTADMFRPTGYLRHVKLMQTSGPGYPSYQAIATITDRYAIEPVSTSTLPFLTDAQRLGRYLRAGRTSDVTVISGAIDVPAWALLTADITSDPRRIANTHHDVTTLDSRLFNDTAPPPDDLCKEIMFPYDYELSVANNYGSYNPCSSRGFLYARLTSTWRGSSAPPAGDSVQTHTSIRSVDDVGRVTSVLYHNDAYRLDDDVCVDTTYATPTGSNERVLTAAASRKVWGCSEGGGNIVYAEESWEYDELPPGNVSQGLMTVHTIQRHATDTGAYLGTIREYDLNYSSSGALTNVVQVRDDGVTRTMSINYEEFGLVPVEVSMSAPPVSPQVATYSVDPLSLQILSSENDGCNARGTTFDGFARPVLSTFTASCETTGSGVLAMRTYLGFDGSDPAGAGRRVVVKRFTDPVPESNVTSQEGRTTTTFLDELGRSRYAQIDLGGDYGNERLIVGTRTYDPVGRVLFAADPYPASQPASTAYGTTEYFAADGSLELVIRGHGFQAYNTMPDASLERFPSVFGHKFGNHIEAVTMQGPDALTSGTPQTNVIHEVVSSAVGRVLQRSTWQGANRLQRADFSYDRVGQMTGMIRYQNPFNGTNPVDWSWSLDSLGRVLQVSEPDSVPQQRVYSSFGELKSITWALPSPEPVHSIVNSYDGLGRLTQTEEQNGGITDPDTVHGYEYDTPGSSPLLAARYVEGRLASASSAKTKVVFSYDPYGNVTGRSFSDGGNVYVERQGYRSDGSRAWIELNLPDRNYAPERVEYAYDTAGQLRSMRFSDGQNTEHLYNASQVDPLGRIRSAVFGRQATYTANYADTGRRLPQDVRVSSPAGLRAFTFTGFDPAGRELTRDTNIPGSANIQSVAYDALGRIQRLVRTDAVTTIASWQFGYDPLGNITALTDQLGAADATMSYLATDRDRICRVGYGNSGLGGSECNVVYDSNGSIIYEPTRTGYNKLTYFNSGSLRTLENETGTRATFRYDPLGNVEALDITSGTSLLRSDRRYGQFITERTQKGTTSSTVYLARQFPGPGLDISRRGPSGPWIFQFSEPRGTRFTVDENGAFVQDVEYNAYGEATSNGAQPGTRGYSTEQWNQGDALDRFGLVHLGARVYDPVIGRFLSRDPLLAPRTAATTNPYAFAANDPINLADPTGLQPNPTRNEFLLALEDPKRLPINFGGWGELGLTVRHLANAYDVVMVVKTGVQFLSKPTLETGLAFEREIAETYLGEFGLAGNAFVYGVKVAEKAIGKENIGRGVAALIEPSHFGDKRKLQEEIRHQEWLRKIQREAARRLTEKDLKRINDEFLSRTTTCVEESVCQSEELTSEPSEEDMAWFWNWYLPTQGPSKFPMSGPQSFPPIQVPPELTLSRPPSAVSRPHPLSPAGSGSTAGFLWPMDPDSEHYP